MTLRDVLLILVFGVGNAVLLITLFVLLKILWTTTPT
jgi:hypothetical protein